MDNQSFNERNSLTGNSGLLGLSTIKTKLEPIRIKAFLELYGSDDEESEEKGKESNSDSECDDIQPLPDDADEKTDDHLVTLVEESSIDCRETENSSPRSDAREIGSTEPDRPGSNDATSRTAENADLSVSRYFSDNFSVLEHAQTKTPIREVALRFDACATSRNDRSASDPPIFNERCSDVKSQIPDSSIRMPLAPDTKFEPRESCYCPDDKHFHSAEYVSSASSSVQPASTPGARLAIDTPLKNNPPVGSTRPDPSTSHRSIFQTPRSSEPLHDYSKNHGQTPATIFGNWSKNHMSRTPLQARAATSDSNPRTHAASARSSSRDAPLYEEKRARRPLAETVTSNQRSFDDKSTARRDAEIHASANIHENRNRGILEFMNERCAEKSATRRDCKENRQPPRAVEKLFMNEKPSVLSECTKEPVGSSSRERANENSRIDGARMYERYPANFRIVDSMTPEIKELAERRNNVQASIPNRLRPPNLGQTIVVKGKEYLILGTLGEGMSARVLRVQDVATLELRAIKIVDLSRMDKDCAQGCLQEISMLHKLQAPCIVKMFDHEIKYPMVHVVLEMGDTDFRSLLNSMSEKNRLPLTMILYYWTEMLTAVKHIHDNGVIHSDLKPANFLLVRGRLKLIDFGIASSMNADMTSVVKNNPIGTLNYISPEALMDISGGNSDSPNRNVKYKISFKSDVWSLGCILYSLVYGYTPFHNIRTQWAKVSAITNPQPKISFAMPAGSDAEPMPLILIDVMRKCLRHDPKARPTVGQLLEIPYIPVKQTSEKTVPDIPSNILMKIKYSLNDDEWRQFTEIMEARRN